MQQSLKATVQSDTARWLLRKQLSATHPSLCLRELSQLWLPVQPLSSA